MKLLETKNTRKKHDTVKNLQSLKNSTKHFDSRTTLFCTYDQLNIFTLVKATACQSEGI